MPHPSQASLAPHPQLLNSFLDKTDGRDKLLATVQVGAARVAPRRPPAGHPLSVPATRPCPRTRPGPCGQHCSDPLPLLQYAAMFVAAGQAGDVKKVQASVAAARKVFRIMRVRGEEMRLGAALRGWEPSGGPHWRRACLLALGRWRRLRGATWVLPAFVCARPSLSMIITFSSPNPPVLPSMVPLPLPASHLPQPLEVLNPLLTNPKLDASKPLALELLGKLKPVLMAIYFGGDHVVWAQQVVPTALGC